MATSSRFAAAWGDRVRRRATCLLTRAETRGRHDVGADEMGVAVRGVPRDGTEPRSRSPRGSNPEWAFLSNLEQSTHALDITTSAKRHAAVRTRHPVHDSLLSLPAPRAHGGLSRPARCGGTFGGRVVDEIGVGRAPWAGSEPTAGRAGASLRDGGKPRSHPSPARRSLSRDLA